MSNSEWALTPKTWRCPMSCKYLARICETVIFMRAPSLTSSPAGGNSENRDAPLPCILCSRGASVKQRAAREARVAEATWYFDLLLWRASPIPPQAGVAVYVRGASGRLAAAHIYDDVEPPAA